MKKLRERVSKFILVFLLTVPAISYAQPTTFADLVNNTLLPLLRAMVSTIMGITILIIMWNGAQMIMHADNAQKKGDHRAMMMWSVVILFIMVGVWGIIAIMQRTLGV